MAEQRNLKGAARLNRLIDFNSYPLNIVLKILLKDRTTGENIIWATDSYSHLGNTYHSSAQLRYKDITKLDKNIIQPRVYKALEEQKIRTKVNAEVFTPSWICCLMNNHIDDVWFGKKDVFNKMDGQKWRATYRKIDFPTSGSKTWQGYVDSRRIEITCGEAPYLVSRYDTTTGKILPISHRIGILDRKLRVVNENTETEAEWIKWALRAYQSTYGYEYQGDSLLIARVNLLMTFCDYLQERWDRDPTEDELKVVAHILSWNIWQMNGLTYKTSYDAEADRARYQAIVDDCNKTINECNWHIDLEEMTTGVINKQELIEAITKDASKIYSLNDVIEMVEKEDKTHLAIIYANAHNMKIADEDARDYYDEMYRWRNKLELSKQAMQILRDETLTKKNTIQDAPYCLIRNWRMRRTEYFRDIAQKSKGKGIMKFDFCIGNPPYQGESQANTNRLPPIYNLFMDEAYNIANIVELITPARFLFNAGKTPKDWNEKMLSDENLKILYYEPNSTIVFPNTDIKGGVVISLRNANVSYGAIKLFTAFNELNSILRKVQAFNEPSLSEVVYSGNRFNTSTLYADYPEAKELTYGSTQIKSNAHEKIKAFSDIQQNQDDIMFINILNNKRIYNYLPLRYFDTTHPTYNKFKVIVPEANGSGALGEVLSTPLIGTPLIGTPLIGYSSSFIGIGDFDNQELADNAMKYIKGKFARAMLGILKVTQHGSKAVWKCVPMQDFTENSDIDWTKSIPEIDQQLYKKYGLSQEEIDFIESKVKEMD